MYEEEIHDFQNCYLKGFGRFDPVTLTFHLVTPKLIGFLCYPGRMCGPCLRKVGHGVLEKLIRNSFDTFDPGDLGI